MSIRAMTWAFALPLEPRAKIALLAIADNARDDGVAWPSRDTIAEKSSQSRATVNRRMKLLAEMGVIELRERFREDGTQTTDEIRLNLDLSPREVMQRLQSLKGDSEHENGEDGADERESDDNENRRGGGYQADTLGSHSCSPRVSLVTGGGLHSCNPQDEPSLEPDTPPNPPPGGVPVEDGPLKKPDRAAAEKREALWPRFLAAYPGISDMDQGMARTEFDRLSADDAEWAVSVCPAYAAGCTKLRKSPRNAHLWLRKEMFRNYPKSEIKPPPPDEVWIVEGSDEDRALRFVLRLGRVLSPYVRSGPGGRGYPHVGPVPADVMAMLRFVDSNDLKWPVFARGTPEFGAWQARVRQWSGAGLPLIPGTETIRAPCRWPPRKDGTIYEDHIEGEAS